MVFLRGHDGFGHQSGRESIIPHLLGESYNIPRMDLPVIGLSVKIHFPAWPGFWQIWPIRGPKKNRILENARIGKPTARFDGVWPEKLKSGLKT